MENAAEALKLAAWVLIFVVALSVSMNAITLIKQSIDEISTNADREFLTKYVEGNRDSTGKLITKRLVSAESIVPTIYRNYKGKSRIIFPNDIELYKDENNKSISILDLDIMSFGNDEEKEYFIKRVMMGSSARDISYETQHFGNIKFSSDSLYNKITNSKFIESIGIYYTEEVLGSDVPKTQMTEKRVITYTRQ